MWSANLSSARADVNALLSEQELERAAAIRDPEARRRWISARGLLRALLGEWMGAEPRSLVFEAGRYGKPRLALAGPAFNVSHSGLLAVYAICADREVGIDVELSDRGSHRRDDVAVARRVLGEDVAVELSALTGEARAAAFLTAWVIHEARMKCVGTGIGHAGREAVRGRECLGPGLGEAGRPWVTKVDVGEGAVAALAVAGGPAEVVCAEVIRA